MGKAPTTPLPQAFYFVKVLLKCFSFWVDHQRVGEFPFPPWRRISGVGLRGSKSNMSKMVSIGSSSVGWLLLRLLKSASCYFCNSRKNRSCFSSFFLRFFLRFLSFVEGVFPHFFFFFFFCCWDSICANISLRCSIFFFWKGEVFWGFSSVNIPRNHE